MTKVEGIHKELFSKVDTVKRDVSSRVKVVTLLGVAALLVTILGGAFALLYNQGMSIGDKIGVVHQRITGVHDKVHDVEVKVVTVQEQVKAAQQVQAMMKEDIKEIKENGR